MVKPYFVQVKWRAVICLIAANRKVALLVVTNGKRHIEVVHEFAITVRAHAGEFIDNGNMRPRVVKERPLEGERVGFDVIGLSVTAVPDIKGGVPLPEKPPVPDWVFTEYVCMRAGYRRILARPQLKAHIALDGEGSRVLDTDP